MTSREIHVGDIVTYEPEKTPNLQPEMSYLGRRWIVTQVGTHQHDDGHIRATALTPADNPTSIARHARNWRILETAAYTRVPEPLPTAVGSVIRARCAAGTGLTSPLMLMRVTDDTWVAQDGATWADASVYVPGPDFDVVSLPRPDAIRSGTTSKEAAR